MKEVKIGQQVWMDKNLNVDKFRNGDTILETKTDKDWKEAGEKGIPAWCYYQNDPATEAKYGKLYNWHAVNDPRGLAPEGWHIPTDGEWTQLADFLGDDGLTKLKSKTEWVADGSGTNESGFSGLPGGNRFDNGSFFNFGYYGYWWSATESDDSSAWFRSLSYSIGSVYRYYYGKGKGLSVRCLKN
ncbi:fibrobacter succinogenes major paralogous domain-containing protein [Peijinzhouia sedimentorum]